MTSRNTHALYRPHIVDDEEGPMDWFHGDHAGGMVIPFGVHKGSKINEVELSYLDWCRDNFDRRDHPVLKAYAIYYAGLERSAEDDYENFVVPFGRTYKGKTIHQCRDKPWLQWATTQRYLRKKYPLFFVAARRWLSNPRKHGVKRDVGELLSRTEYADGLDLRDETGDTNSMSDFIEYDMGDYENSSGDEDDNMSQQSDRSSALTGDLEAPVFTWPVTPPRQGGVNVEETGTRRTIGQTRSSGNSRNDDWIDDEPASDGSRTYRPSFGPSPIQTSASTRVTRSHAKMNTEKTSASSTSHTCSRHRLYKKVFIKPNSVSSEEKTPPPPVQQSTAKHLRKPKRVVQSEPSSEDELRLGHNIYTKSAYRPSPPTEDDSDEPTHVLKYRRMSLPEKGLRTPNSVKGKGKADEHDGDLESPTAYIRAGINTMLSPSPPAGTQEGGTMLPQQLGGAGPSSRKYPSSHTPRKRINGRSKRKSI